MRVLLVEDDSLTVRLLKAAIGPSHFLVSVSTVEEGLRLIPEQAWDFALIDLNLTKKMDGLALLPSLKKHAIFSVVISGHEEDEVIEACYRAGCDDYYAKGDLASTVPQLMQKVMLSRRTALPDKIFETVYLTQDRDTIHSARTMMTAVENSTPGLIMGETGTGKSELVKVLFSQAGLKGNLVEINCASLPKELIESELFGHEKGAFTGADKTRVGKVKHADEGILFLDEIGCLPLDVQAKFLKVLEEKKFYPVGSIEPQVSKFRLIAATNEDLFALAAKGLFRMDLLQRLCGSVITLKPLRQRPDDVWTLLKNLPAGPRRLSFTAEAKTLIAQHSWPGNIRELRRFHEHCMTAVSGRIDTPVVSEFLMSKAASASTLLPDGLTELALAHGLEELTEKIREHVIQEVLRRNEGHGGKTMKMLGVSTRQFYKYIKADSGAAHVQ